MGIYETLGATSKRLIKKYGQQVTYQTRSSTPLPDADKPWLPSDAVSEEQPVRMVFTKDRLDDREALRYMKDTEIVDGQINAIMAFVEGLVPKLKDVIIRNGQMLTIDNINPVSPGGVILIYQFELGS